MRKVLAVILALCMALSIGSMALADGNTQERTAPLTLMEGWDSLFEETESGFYMSVRVPAVFVAEEQVEAFPQLQKAFDGFNAELRKDAEDTFNLMKENATEEFIKSGLYQGLESESWIEYHRAGDANAVSVLVYSCMELGGPHPSHTYTARTFDCQTGDVISLGEVIKDTDQLAKLLAEQLKAEATSEDEFIVDDLEAAIKERIENGNLVWTVDYQGMTFYFPQEDLSVYAAGAKSVFIPYGINTDIYNDVPYIGTTANEYVVSLSADRTLGFMLDENVPVNNISVSGAEDENGDKNELDIFVDDVKTAVPAHFFYTSTISLVHKDNKNYLYVGIVYENDCQEMLVFEINKDKTATQKGSMSMTGLYSKNGRNGYAETLCAFDPMNFRMNTSVDVLSTATGYRDYQTGNDGMPVPLQNAYTLVSPYTLTLLQDMNGVTLLDETSGKASGKTDLKAGDYVTVEKVDPEAKTVDAVLTDARIVQFSYSLTDGGLPVIVNGIEAEKLFDGMVYAG